MKHTASCLMASVAIGLLTACNAQPGTGDKASDSTKSDATTGATTAAGSPAAAKAEENVKGEFLPANAADEAEGTTRVSISAIPTTRAAFEQLRTQLGGRPEGVVALELMAYEMYRHNPDLGRECIALNNTESNVNCVVGRLHELLPAASTAEGREWKDDGYARPYLVMTFCEGASPENGYTPTLPYTFRIRHSRVKADEKSQMLHGTVMTYEVYSTGYDTPWREVQVVQPKGSEHYLVSNCPAIYTQCKEPE